MHRQRTVNNHVHIYMSEFSARVVAESGTHTDQYHLGKHILQGLKDAPNFVLQIDGATGKSETCSSVLKRSVRCATALRRLGLQRGDVMVLMAPNHLDLAIPYYAALYLGIIIAPIDMTLKLTELQNIFVVDKPKIIFCQNERVLDVKTALKNLNNNSVVISFDENRGNEEICFNFNEIMEKYGNDCIVNDFRAEDFDANKTSAFIVSTSGTTGLPKQAEASYKNIMITNPYLWSKYTKFPNPVSKVLIVSPLQWVSAQLHFNLSPIIRYTRVQSSATITQEHTYDMINTYKPSLMIISPTFLATLMRPGDREKCDFTCFEEIYVGGSAVSNELLEEIKKVASNSSPCNAYGMSEITGIIFSLQTKPFGSSGTWLGHIQYRLVNTDTQEDIVEPNKPGELWVKSPGLVKGYFNLPEETKKAFRDDGWFRTGDIFYRDENWNFFFVEKLKLLLKYKNHQVSPTEVESVIHKHPEVLDVAVSSIPDKECGDLLVACVVKQPGSQVTAQEIKDLVKSKLTDTKHLHGGVIFLDSLPLTSTGKLDRQRLKKIVQEEDKE